MQSLRYRILSGVALVGTLWARPLLAQNVTEIQISPPQVQMRPGERTQVFATAYTQGGNVAIGVVFRWNSSDTNVVRVVPDPQSPEIGTLVAAGPGAAVVAAITGPGTGIRGFTTVSVSGPQPQPAPAPPIAAVAPIVVDSVLPAATAAASLRTAARIEAQRYMSPTACASGAVIGNGLVATSYQAIRGADRITVSLENGTMVQDPQVVAYNVSNDIVILRIVAPTFDSLPLTGNARTDQYAWAVSYPACQAVASTTRVRITGTSGVLRHSGTLPESGAGSALVNSDGALLGMVNGDRSVAAPSSMVQSAVTDARTNARPASVADVGRSENHLYGSLIARSDVPSSSARVTPLETWQWSSLSREGTVPVTFTGPVGRYQVDLIVNGAVRASTTVRVAAAATAQVNLAPPVAQAPATPAQQPAAAPPQTPTPTPAAPPPPVVARKRGSPVVPIVVLLGLGGGAAACFTVGPCKKSDTTDTDGTATGGISVTVPNP